AQVQLHAALKQNENQRERAQKLSESTKLIGVNPLEYGAEHQAGDQKHHEVGNAGNPEEAVGDEGQHQESADQPEDLDLVQAASPRSLAMLPLPGWRGGSEVHRAPG